MFPHSLWCNMIPIALYLGLAVLCPVLAQVTETVTPNPEECSSLVTDLNSYFSALQTQPLYQQATSEIFAQSATIFTVGVALDTENWSENIALLNNLIATTYPSAIPSVVAQMYNSVYNEEASIINKDVTHTGQNLITASATSISEPGFVTTVIVVTTVPPSSASSPTATPQSASTSSDALSTGAKAGIGVGTAIGILALVCIAVFVLKRRRARAMREKSNNYTGPGLADDDIGVAVDDEEKP